MQCVTKGRIAGWIGAFSVFGLALTPMLAFAQPPVEGQPQPKIIAVQKKIVEMKPPGSLETKIDKLLQEMAEMRKDINQLKARLDAKGPDRGPWQQFGWFGPAKEGKDAKDPRPEASGIRILRIGDAGANPAEMKLLFRVENLDKEKLDAIRDALKKLEDAGIRVPDRPAPETKKTGRPELEERLERIQREAEALRRELQKSRDR